MNDCIICYERVHTGFQPDFRPSNCNCKYIIHPHCYNSWLESTGLAYNCMMCRVKITHQEAARIREQEIRNATGIFKGIIYVCICYFISVYYKEILVLLLLSSILKIDGFLLRILNHVNNRI